MQSLQFTFEAIGTRWVIDGNDVPDTIQIDKIRNAVGECIADFDRIYSRFREDSLISIMATRIGTYSLPENAKPLLELYHRLYTITGGAFTPLIGKTMEEAGYDKTYSLKAGPLHHPPGWDETMDYRHPDLTIKKPALLDFGAAGKGYVIDIVGQLLITAGIPEFCIDAGGDILSVSAKKNPLRIGLEHPENTEQVIGVATITNQAICGSSGNRRKWEGFHHIINPHSLKSTETILATWVVAHTTMVADALATCLFFTEAAILKKHFAFEYLVLFPDYSIEKSFDFPGELFYNNEGKA
jgi:thiamine biosynthesis lipoprotein